MRLLHVVTHAFTNERVVMEEDKSTVKTFGTFVFPQIHDNVDGWGPCEVPEQFRDTPYQPFSKDDRLGKVCEQCISLHSQRNTLTYSLPWEVNCFKITGCVGSQASFFPSVLPSLGMDTYM